VDKRTGDFSGKARGAAIAPPLSQSAEFELQSEHFPNVSPPILLRQYLNFENLANEELKIPFTAVNTLLYNISDLRRIM